MDHNKIDRIIEIIKGKLEEEVTLGSGQIAGTAEAGDDPPVRKRKKYISGGRGSRKLWLHYLTQNTQNNGRSKS